MVERVAKFHTGQLVHNRSTKEDGLSAAFLQTMASITYEARDKISPSLTVKSLGASTLDQSARRLSPPTNSSLVHLCTFAATSKPRTFLQQRQKKFGTSHV
jgi:hypothetical protein